MSECKVLIMGVQGFVGPHLARHYIEQNKELGTRTATEGFYLEQNPYKIYGVMRHVRSPMNIDYAGFNGSLDGLDGLYTCDLIDASGVDALIGTLKPDIIHHLAAQSYVPASWTNPWTTFETNVGSTINILESVRRHCPECVVHIASSSECFGKVESGTKITEEHPKLPLSPYGISKVAQANLGYQYHKSYGLRTRVSYAFNHEGSGRGSVFVTSSFAEQAVRCDAKGGYISYGNLDAVRDFTFCPETVEAYRLLATHPDIQDGEPYNICSGKYHKIEEIKDIIQAKFPSVIWKQDPARMRPSDVEWLWGSHEKFSAVTGWEPKFGLKEIMDDIIEWHIKRYKV